MFIAGVSAQSLSAEDDVWYDAAGTIVKVTAAEAPKSRASYYTEKAPYQSTALYALNGGSERRVQQFGRNYSYSQYFRHSGWRSSQYSGRGSRSGFRGRFRKGGLSVRLKF